ncbi:MAG: ferritin family protein [Deltaproteobacteria bacterium]|nr:ferritin family protein [Deltaproteobacteria bacterium]
MFTLDEVIDLAVKIEQNGERVYREAAETAEPGPIQDLLIKLADNEVEHAKWFTQLRSEVKTETDNPKLYEMGREILNNILGEQSFSLKDVDFSKMGDIDEVLKTALEFERDTILFYNMLSAAVDEDVLPYMKIGKGSGRFYLLTSCF